MTPFNAPNILGTLLFFPLKDLFTSIDVCEFLACTYVCMVMCVPDAYKRPDEGTESPGIGVKDACLSSRGCWEPKLGTTLQEQ